MKITIENIPPGDEPEIIVRCSELDDSLLNLIHNIKSASKKIIGYLGPEMHIIEPRDVYYFEAVENRVFVYCREKVYESRMKLYEIETGYERPDFFRASKSVILNLEKVESIKASFSGRLEALLHNGEKIIISRQYVPDLKRKLGL